MGRRTSFKEQMIRTLNRKNCFGQSRQAAKQESYAAGHGGRVDGIYSKKTMKDYKAVAVQFDTWQKQKGFRFRSMKEVQPQHIRQYLTERQDRGASAWTLSRDLSALNKIFGTALTKKETGLKARKQEDIKNNRGLGKNYRQTVYRRNRELTEFIHATGIRRQSVPLIRPSDAVRGTDYKVMGFHVKEKGGRERNCYVLREKREQVTEFVNAMQEKNGDAPLFPLPDRNLNTHWYRAQYARDLYRGIARARQAGQDYFEGCRQTYVDEGKLTRAVKGLKAQTKGFDTLILAEVSQQPGHNRIDVVYTHYLY